MKLSRPPILTTRQGHPLSFLDFIRFAAILTLCIFPVVILLTALLAFKNLDGTVWALAAFLALFPVWVGTLTVGCVVMIPVWIWRLCNRLPGKLGRNPLNRSSSGINGWTVLIRCERDK